MRIVEPMQQLPIELTTVYNNPNHNMQGQVWNYLRNLSSRVNNAWIVAGDFNAMLNNNEKFGVKKIKNSRMNDFASCLTDCGLTDLGYCGNKFTWSNRHFNDSFISERLDRACGNLKWLRRFPSTIVRNLPNTY